MPRSAQRIDSMVEWAEHVSGRVLRPEGKSMSESSEANVPVRGKVNFFFTDENGYKGHAELTPEMQQEDLNALWHNAKTWSSWMAQHNWKPDAGPSRNGPVAVQEAAPGPKAAAAPTRLRAPECANCGGPVWDNRDNKRNPKAPDFKCKDSENCGGAGWIQKDGGIKWADQ